MARRVPAIRKRTISGVDEWGNPTIETTTITIMIGEEDFQPYTRTDSGFQVTESGFLKNVFRRMFVFQKNADIKIGDTIEFEEEEFDVIDLHKYAGSHLEVILGREGA